MRQTNESTQIQTDIPVWNTEQFRFADRIEAWTEVLTQSHLPWSLSEKPGNSFYASVSLRQLHDSRIIKCKCGPQKGYRAKSEIGMSDGDYIAILYILKGKEVIEIANEQMLLEAGNFVIWDSSRPMSFHVPEHLEKISLIVPAESMTSIFPNVHDYCGKVIRRQDGISAIFINLLRSLELEMWNTNTNQLSTIMRPTLEMLSTVFTSLIDLPHETMRDGQLALIKQYILKDLYNPELTPQRIAEHHGISVRYLHQLFENNGATVSAWIKAQRLERCRKELTSPASASQSITDIAFQWGFNDVSHFSKSFKQQFGISPREFRNINKKLM